MEDQRRGLGTMAIGLGLMALGGLFLLGQLLHLNIWATLWPFFIIIPGLSFFFGMVAMGKRGAPLAVPGSIVTTVGLILLYQAITGHWTSWAYAWALIFPTAIGVGLVIAGIWGDKAKTLKTGVTLTGIGVIVFLFFGVFFELLLNISGFRNGFFGRLLFPLMFIGAGVVVLLLALFPRRRLRD